jgi:hypothetical protein
MANRIICNASYTKLDALLDFVFPGIDFNRTRVTDEGSSLNEGKKYLINTASLNNRNQIDAYLVQINSELNCGDYFIGCAEYKSTRILNRRHRLLVKTENIFSAFFNSFVPSFLINTNDRQLSKIEILGRVYRHGFAIRLLQKKDNYLYFIAQKRMFM